MKRQLYRLELNGQQYGIGDWDYIQELLTDYISTMDMYGQNSVDIRIVNRNKERENIREVWRRIDEL